MCKDNMRITSKVAFYQNLLCLAEDQKIRGTQWKLTLVNNPFHLFANNYTTQDASTYFQIYFTQKIKYDVLFSVSFEMISVNNTIHISSIF